MMIFLGISINILGSVIYSKIESRDLLRQNAACKARQVAIYCIRCAIFAFFVNFSASFFFFLFTRYSRNSIIHMSDETYLRKTRETNWKGRSKEDFIDALESDLKFYSYYSLASLIGSHFKLFVLKKLFIKILDARKLEIPKYEKISNLS